jgi:hypothetical protein
MPARSPFLPSADAPLRLRLVIGWGAFFLFVVAGIVFAWTLGRAVPALLNELAR